MAVSALTAARPIPGRNAASNAAPTAPDGIETVRPPAGREPRFVEDALENLDLAPQHLKLTQVGLMDQTDVHNELVFEDEWLLHTAETVRLAGNLFHLEDPLTGNGLLFLKEAPLPNARPVRTETDFVYEPSARRCRLLGNGSGPAGGEGYRFIVLAYSGRRAGRIEALQAYQRQVRTYDPKRDAMFLSNTWGDRSRDARVNAGFMTKEVQSGARLGVDVVQIDDGWQRGRTSNSASGNGVWTGFWAADPQFWDADPVRFAGGLLPVVKLAAASGMRFGLWFAPDSSGGRRQNPRSPSRYRHRLL